MLVVRPAGSADYDALMGLAQASGPGFTSLPEHEPTLRRRLEISEGSFSETLPVEDRWYVLMMEETDTGQVVGLAGVKAAVGLKRPFASFRRMTFSHYHVSEEAGSHRNDQPALVFVNECRGWTEVGSLFLKPESRVGGAGALLSRSRYLLIGTRPELFNNMVLAELRGRFDAQGKSPFWEHVTSKFFGMDFESADELSGKGDGQFIFDLAPHHPLYESLMHRDAQAAIGQVFEEGKPAKKLLEREGFQANGLVDVFDAGPTMACQRDAIRTVREARMTRAIVTAEVEGDPHLLSTTGLMNFRATRAIAEPVEGGIEISLETAEALKIKDGDPVRAIL
ncbi:arginine N-succinyltransferase [Brevundimonas aveniformis]|uniref:arginine N-succinyltransferase n=1 Tax=Brevundimonas aveniformis TaxID=370977 RepID=UPI00248FB12B|nr:arginine N-succinyltransferase [Brevundimonas aveniformis]